MFNKGNTKKTNTAIIIIFVVIAAFTFVAGHYGTKTTSAVRAYVTGEGQWTKAQKEATHQLILYSIHQDTSYYNNFREKLKLHHSFTEARKTLLSENPDIFRATQKFKTSDLHSDDIDLIIWLTRNFKEFSHFKKALAIWEEGDKYIAKLDSLGYQVHQTIQAEEMNQSKQLQYLTKVSSLDNTLTDLETRFSSVMGATARWIQTTVFWMIITVGAILIIIGYLLTRRFFNQINQLNRQLYESETKFKKVLRYSRDVIYQLNFDTADYEYMSPYVEKMLGYTVEEILGRGKEFILDLIHPDDLERLNREVKQMEGEQLEEQFTQTTEFRIKRKDGHYIWVNNQRSLVKDEEGNPIAIVGSVRDISDRKNHEVEIQQALKEKKTLLVEIHHRVKNNLAVISSLLELQKQESGEAVETVLEKTQTRIQSIAKIHEKLYQTKDLSNINIDEYIDEFTSVIFDAYNISERDIIIHKRLDSFKIDIIKAVPLALIYNELLNNAFKHGFDNQEEGKISINLTKGENQATLTVTNDGNTLPDNFSLDEDQSLGMTLVLTLTQQLEGDINYSQNGHTAFEITFPINKGDIA
ncbi:sensor histidine kinase [Fodinibius sp. Rm-B-1B1-1]|uniref:sensor histidine kinase n=1 Tax=Fodinibius alkaliphilus TaxID=3140241 RepID=UPI00315A4114